MRVNAGIFIIICLLFLVGTVGAVIPDKVVITGNSSWIVAGSGPSTYTVTVTNQTTVKVQNADVSFSVNNSLGTFPPGIKQTDSNGIASNIFTVGTKSGTAKISVRVQYNGGTDGIFDKTYTFDQNIDHDSPFYDISISPPLFTYPEQGTVASQVPFKVSILDKWGNPIDNRRGPHNIGLHVSSALVPDDCYFVGYGQDISLPLDANGTRSVMVKLTTKRGINRILMDNFEGKISSQIAEIMAMADQTPYSMTGSISNGGVLPVNNELPVSTRYKFTIDYYLYDKYDNPIGNKSILITTDLPGETNPILPYPRSDANGLIRFYYGPKISILTANITAIAVDNSSVTNRLKAKFVSSNNPSNLFLVVNPQTMASRETDPSTTREAKVIAILNDEFGNPITNKEIQFEISPISTGLPDTNPGPSFESLSTNLIKNSTTASDGSATLTFYPGSLVKEGQPGYIESANGSCKVTATYGPLTSNTVIVEWKNFAYLSATVNVTPKTVFLNDTIDVNIKITGDGYKMVNRPISVVLDLDTTSAMNAAEADDPGGPSRFIYEKDAAKHFVDSLNASDQVGLVTWGEFADQKFWQVVQTKSYNHAMIISNISSLIESGGQDISVRQSIEAAASGLLVNSNSNEVGAIITLGASSYDPGDLTPMVDETLNKGIRVYSISYVSSDCNLKSDGITYTNSKTEEMSLLARSAGGIHYCCTNSSGVIAAMDAIKQNLSTIAGVDTSMNLDFTNVHVNNTMMNGTINGMMDGRDVFDYVFIGPEIAPQPVHYPDRRTNIIWTDDNQSVVDQTNEWNNTGTLNFTIGTIHIHETWETTYQLRVKMEGIIDLFGPGSNISYNGNPGTLKLPTTVITSINNTFPIGLTSGTLSVTNLLPDESGGNYTDSVSMTWDLTYKGSDQATETYWYSYKGQPFVQFGSSPPIDSTGGLAIPRNTNLDVTNFPLGKYRIKVIASVPGIPPAEDSGAFTKVSGGGKPYIKLE